MNATIKRFAVIFTVLVAVPLLAQQGDSQSTEPAAVAQAEQQSTPAAAVSNQVEPAHVVGTLVSVGSDRLELMVEKAIGPSVESLAVLVGQTLPFILDAGTERPAELKAGEGVDLWFTENHGQGYAVRVVVSRPADEPSKDSMAQQGSTAPPNVEPPATGPPAAEAQQPPIAGTAANTPVGSAAAPDSATTQAVRKEEAPSEPAPQPAHPPAVAPKRHTKALVPPAPQPADAPVVADSGALRTAAAPSAVAPVRPAVSPQPSGSVDVSETVGGATPNATRYSAASQPSDPLRFIALGAAAAAAALALLYLTLRGRGRVLDLGLHAGKGGAL